MSDLMKENTAHSAQQVSTENLPNYLQYCNITFNTLFVSAVVVFYGCNECILILKLLSEIFSILDTIIILLSRYQYMSSPKSTNTFIVIK